MNIYDTTTTEEEIADGIKDESGVIYSRDGRRLLRCESNRLGSGDNREEGYKVHEGTEVICDEAFCHMVSMGCAPFSGIYVYRIILPGSIRAIGKSAFRDCWLTKINLPEGLTHIDDLAFYNTNLEDIKFPDSLLSIGSNAFAGNLSLKEITIPRSVTHIGMAPFKECENMESIMVDAENSHFTIHEGLLCDIDKSRIIQCPMNNDSEFTLPRPDVSYDKGSFDGLERFLEAQDSCHTYQRALEEVKSGMKRTHWIWYIFPQMVGLGHSNNSKYYGIKGRQEAEKYIRNTVLRDRLVEITEAVYDNKNSVYEIFGSDTIKVRSCMLLFASVCDIPVFRKMINKYGWK